MELQTLCRHEIVKLEQHPTLSKVAIPDDLEGRHIWHISVSAVDRFHGCPGAPVCSVFEVP
ncbi:hypothetical protein [Paraburkholderia youngii]|uniref:hypothetical protein n=1 Tax=Paraburkholderia youngii TaxID=2782701 RepID=UPI003D1A857A